MTDGIRVPVEDVDGLRPEHLLDGRYRVVRRIAVGGMASVYVAEHTMIGRPVAVKVLHPQFAQDPECVRRFLAEGRAAGTLGHPHIVESTDMGTTANGAPFLVLELLEGRNLEDEVRRVRRLPIARAIRIAQQIASALTAAHARGIVHRDLKSANVFLVDCGREDVDHVKVLDFGISKFTQGHAHTQKGELLGTPWFMSPEQIRDPASVDERCDVYALGVILYETLTGQVPFIDSPFPVVFNRILEDDPPPVEGLRPEVGPELAAIVRGAMRKAAAERTASMAELARALAAVGGPLRIEMRGRAPSRADYEQGDTLTDVTAAVPTSVPTPAAPVESMDVPATARHHSEVEWDVPAPRAAVVWRTRILVGLAAVAVVAAVATALSARDRDRGIGAAADGAERSAARAEPTVGTGGGEAAAAATTAAAAAIPGDVVGGPAATDLAPATGADAPAATLVEREALSIRSGVRGAIVTFRGESHRLPFRAELPRGDRSELVQVTAPGRLPASRWITLDRPQRLRLDPGPAGDGDGDRAVLTAAPAPTAPAAATSVSPSPSSAIPPPPSPAPAQPSVSTPAHPPATAHPAASKPASGPAPGTMDREATRRAVQRHLGEVQTCFERGRMDTPQLAGRVVVRMTVDPSGRVVSAEVAASTLENRTVEVCIASTVRTWTLPAPAGGIGTTITYPFVFK